MHPKTNPRDQGPDDLQKNLLNETPDFKLLVDLLTNMEIKLVRESENVVGVEKKLRNQRVRRVGRCLENIQALRVLAEDIIITMKKLDALDKVIASKLAARKRES